MKAPYTMYGQMRYVPVITFTNCQRDEYPKDTWNKELWIQDPADLLCLNAQGFKGKIVRVVYREDWLRAQKVEEVYT